jgi:hypothetical protein
MARNLYPLDDIGAIVALRDGERVKCKEWADGNWIQIIDGVLMTAHGNRASMSTWFDASMIVARARRWRIVPRTMTVELKEDEAAEVCAALLYMCSDEMTAGRRSKLYDLSKRFER